MKSNLTNQSTDAPKQYNLFIQQLEELAKTMSTSKEDSFNMKQWYAYSSCGYVACICGEQAIKGDLELFPYAKAIKAIKADKITEEKSYSSDFSAIASKIADDLAESESIYSYSSYPYLARSVYTAYSADRQQRLDSAYTEGSILHNLYETLSNQPHITTNSSPAHATSYLTLLANSLKEIEDAK